MSNFDHWIDHGKASDTSCADYHLDFEELNPPSVLIKSGANSGARIRSIFLIKDLIPPTAVFAQIRRQDTKCRTEAPITPDHAVKRMANVTVVTCRNALSPDTNPDKVVLTGIRIEDVSPAG
jgi:hypothetical protein